MNSKASASLITFERVDAFLHLEAAIVILGMWVGAWLIYKTSLRGVSEERHGRLRGLFRDIAMHLLYAAILVGIYSALAHVAVSQGGAFRRLAAYGGLLAIFMGASLFVKICRVLLFEYLFLKNMRAGVPVLLVNLFTLLLSIFMAGWMLADIFNVKLTPILATSAIFSLVLGLALQDTLGNLFSGVALQIDKPYEIGDWVEVFNGPQKIVGQIYEITWRATTLVGLSDESLILPNRVMAQAQVSNFSNRTRPIVRREEFRLPHGVDPEQVKAILIRVCAKVPKIRRNPAPSVLIADTTESWLLFKLIYFIDDYGSQWTAEDQILTLALADFAASGIELANAKILVQNISNTPAPIA